MAVCLLLKADMEVSFYTVAVLRQQAEPFRDVPKVEADIKQFPLLGRVYALMVQCHVVKHLRREDDAEEVDSVEAATYRKPPYMDYPCHYLSFGMQIHSIM